MFGAEDESEDGTDNDEEDDDEEEGDEDDDEEDGMNDYNFKLFTKQSQLLMILRKEPFENIVKKGENGGNQHFLLFPQCFLSFSKQI